MYAEVMYGQNTIIKNSLVKMWKTILSLYILIILLLSSSFFYYNILTVHYLVNWNQMEVNVS